MRKKKAGKISKTFEKFASKTTHYTGRPSAFFIAFGIVIIWLITGPIFKYSDTWQLVINTGTTIITFLMVFLIQQTQNKDSRALQLKLNEIVAAMDGASNRLINVEDMTEDELITLHNYYTKLVEMAKKDVTLNHSHSLDEAMEKHKTKLKKIKKPS
jgi:low affinity Fe/Cu permease